MNGIYAMNKALRYILAAVALVLLSGQATALTENEIQCGPLQNAFGPFDYRVAPQNQKQLVEGAHFTSNVERLVRGHTATEPTPDIDYTLRAFPNHPRALLALMEWGFRKKTDHPRGAKWPVWCYFDRAIRFQPDDPQVKMLYGVYLQRKGKLKEAAEQLLEAEKLAGENANLLYNIGLVYLDLGNSDKALEYAHRVYPMSFPLEGLRNRLKRVGKWKEPAPLNKAPGEDLGDTQSRSSKQ